MGDGEIQYLLYLLMMEQGMTYDEAADVIATMNTPTLADDSPPGNLQPIGMDNAQDLENELNRFTGDGPSFDPSPQEGDLLGGLGPGGLSHPWNYPDRTNERNSSAYFGNGEPRESSGVKARMGLELPNANAANDILLFLLEKAVAAGRPTQGLERAVSNQAKPTAPPGRNPATQVRTAALKSNPTPQRTMKPNPPPTRARTVVASKPAPKPAYRPPAVIAKPAYAPPPTRATVPYRSVATAAKPTSALLKAPR
jgi:hypothetical protein